MFRNIRKRLDEQGNLAGYVVEHEQGFDYDVPLDWVDESYSFEAVHEYAIAHPDEVIIYVELVEETDEIDAIKQQLAALDFKTTKATEEAALAGLSLQDFINTDEGATYKETFVLKKDLRAKIN